MVFSVFSLLLGLCAAGTNAASKLNMQADGQLATLEYNGATGLTFDKQMRVLYSGGDYALRVETDGEYGVRRLTFLSLAVIFSAGRNGHILFRIPRNRRGSSRQGTFG